jgi:hypothetical protein
MPEDQMLPARTPSELFEGSFFASVTPELFPPFTREPNFHCACLIDCTLD